MKRCAIIFLFLGTQAIFAQFNLYLDSQIPVSADRVSRIQMSKDGRFLALGGSNGRVTIWDIGAKRMLHELKGHYGEIGGLIFDSKQRNLITGGSDGKILVWDLYSGQLQQTIKDFGSSVLSIVLSPDDRMLAAAGKKSDIYLWEFPIGTLKGKLRGHKKNVMGVAFNVNGDQILSVSEDRQMIVWNVNTLELIRKTSIEARTMQGSGIDIKSAAYSFDSQFAGVGIQEYVLAKGGNRMIFKYNMSFYDWKTGAEIETLEDNRKDVDFFVISPDKNYAITDNSTLRKNEISFWNIQKGVVEQNYPIDGKISAIGICEDGKWLAVGYQDPSNASRSIVNVWQVSGIEGFQRFATGQTVRSSGASGFGASIRVTTPEEPLIQFGQRKRMAVMYFDSPGQSEDIGKTTSYLLEAKLGNSPLVELVERNQIQKVLNELSYQQTGLTASNAAEVGKHLNAEYMLMGSLNKLGNLLIITSKLVNVETAQIEGTREVQCSNATIENISDMVAVLAPTIVKY
ncbi:MAG: WD40 repeat domain-containing protein [bacterium]